jgi:hypothetical protein
VAPLVLGQRPPRGVLADRDQRGARAGGPAEPFLLVLLALMAAAIAAGLVLMLWPGAESVVRSGN